MSSFLKDLLSVGLSKIGVIVLGLAQAVIVARWLGPELNGVLAALLVYPSLFMSIGSLGISQATTYFIARGIYSEDQIKTAVVQVWFFSSVFCVISSFLLIKYFSNSGQDLSLVLLALAPIPFTLFNVYNSGVFLGKNQIKEYNKINWLPPFFILITTVFLVVVFNFSLNGAMLGLIMGPAIMSVIMLIKNRFIDFFSFEFEWPVIKSLLSLGLVYAFSLFIINLNYKLDVILLDKMSTSYQTGIYSKGVSLIQYLWHIPMLLSTIIFARSAISKDQRAFSYKVCQLLRISIVVISICCVVLAVAAPVVINLLFGIEFKESADVLIYLIPGVILLTFFKVLNMDLAGRGKPWISLKAMFPALVLNTILNFYLIPEYGASGASIASTLSYSLAAFIFLFVYSREVDIPIKEILKFRKGDIEFVPILVHKMKQKIFSQ